MSRYPSNTRNPSFSIQKLAELWDQGVSAKEIARILSTAQKQVSEESVKNARFKYGLTPRKGWNPVTNAKPARMKRRCLQCSGRYETGKDWEPHEGCQGQGGFSIYVESAA